MLEIIVPETNKLWSPVCELFLTTNETKLVLEHSLVAVSKWEAKWHTPFLSNKQLTPVMLRDYVRCMTITQNVDPLVYYALTEDNLRDIMEYIENPMTATTINEKALQSISNGPRSGRIITSDLIYYWMTALNIPFECQKWHLNRLMTLIKVASIEQQPPKKMSRKEALSQQKALNAARRARLGSRG